MRDPDGHVEFEGSEVKRKLNSQLALDHFLQLKAAQKLVESNHLIRYEISEDLRLLRSAKTPFVSYPYEWSDGQFADAAELTLHISELALEEAWELKDASAWNIVFNGTNPQFCDHLSFQPIFRQRWWAFGQFIRHFVLPLGISKISGLRSYNIFKIDRDGLTPQLAKKLAGFRIFLTRYWPLVIASESTAVGTKRSEDEQIVNSSSAFHKRLYAICRWMLKGGKRNHPKSAWSGYVDSRTHYSRAAQEQKHQKIDGWLKEKSPNWVIDLGCNTGEFSVLSASHGARVVAVDVDHDCIEKLYSQQKGNASIFPVIANLDDIAGGRGWDSAEFPGLLVRLEAVGDMVLMLALIHHMAILSSIPLPEIAKLARRLAKRWLVLEILDETDPLIELLCRQRNRLPSEFSLQSQLTAFERYFVIEERVSLAETGRHLLLMVPR